MPIHKIEKINNHRFLAIWHIEESFDALYEELNPLLEEGILLNRFRNPKKKLEWLAARLVIKALCEASNIEFNGISKNEYGKPLLNNNKSEISLTHSYPYVAAIIDTFHCVGVDLEQPKEKLLKVSHKFLNDQELQDAEKHIEKLCIYWCAKETLYKIHSEKALYFKENMFIEPFKLSAKGVLFARIAVNDTSKRYKLEYRIENHYILTFNLD